MNAMPRHPIDGGPAGPAKPGDPDFVPPADGPPTQDEVLRMVRWLLIESKPATVAAALKPMLDEARAHIKETMYQLVQTYEEKKDVRLILRRCDGMTYKHNVFVAKPDGCPDYQRLVATFAHEADARQYVAEQNAPGNLDDFASNIEDMLADVPRDQWPIMQEA